MVVKRDTKFDDPNFKIYWDFALKLKFVTLKYRSRSSTSALVVVKQDAKLNAEYLPKDKKTLQYTI